jgi:hypothetical protein
VQKPESGASPVEFARWLRQCTPEERLAWVIATAMESPDFAFNVGKRLGLKKREARKVVEETIECSDVSTIRCWIEFYANVAGIGGAVELLDDWRRLGLEERAGRAAYWLDTIDLANTPEAREILAAFGRRAREASIRRRARARQ